MLWDSEAIPLHCLLAKSNNRTRGQFECEAAWFCFHFDFVRSHARCLLLFHNLLEGVGSSFKIGCPRSSGLKNFKCRWTGGLGSWKLDKLHGPHMCIVPYWKLYFCAVWWCLRIFKALKLLCWAKNDLHSFLAKYKYLAWMTVRCKFSYVSCYIFNRVILNKNLRRLSQKLQCVDKLFSLFIMYDIFLYCRSDCNWYLHFSWQHKT